MDGLDFTAVLTDTMTATLDAIIAGLEQIAEAAASAGDALSAAFGDASVEADALAGSTDAAAASTDALAGSMDAASASTDANTASTDANAAAAQGAADAHTKMAAAAKAMILPLALGAAVVVGIGAAAVHMAGDFQSGLTTLVTGAGESQANLGMIHDGILNMSVATGESTKQLIDGMFMIESAGHHGADALQVLQASAEGAKVGAADLGTVADATTTIMTDFANQHITAANAVNELIATVSSGKTHMQDLAGAMAQILPTASAAGISLNGVMGAMATMTGEGVPAANAATYLRQTIIALEAPSKQTVTALKSVGLTTTQVADAMHKSLPDALAMITDAVGKKFPVGSAGYVSAIKAISGGSKQMQGMLDLTGQHMATFVTNTKNIGEAAQQGGKSITGWSLVQKDFNQQLSQLGATLGVMMIKLGEALMPVATALTQHLQPALQWIVDHGQLVAIGLGVLAAVLIGALAPALGVVIGEFFAANVAMLPMIGIGAAIGAGVALLIGGFILLYTHVAGFRQAIHGFVAALGQAWTWIKQLGATIAADLAPTFHQLGDTLKNELLPAWRSLQSAFVTVEPLLKVLAIAIGGVLVTAVGLLIGIFTGLVEAFATVLSGVVTFVGGLIQALTGVVKLIVDLWSGFFTILSDIFSGNWTKLGADAHAWGMTLWRDLVQIVSGLGNAVMGLFQVFIGGSIAFVKGFVTGVVAFFGDLFDKLVGHSIIPDMVNAIIAWFEQLPGRAVAAVKTLATALLGAFTGLATDATKWGSNLITNFINGIKNMAGAVGSAAGGVASTIGKFLGFHSPAEEGPGASADQWMPNLVAMLAQGLTQHAPLLGRAAQTAAGQIAGALGSPTGTLGANGGAFPASALATGAGIGGLGSPSQITVVLKDETGVGGFMAGMRMLDPRMRQLLAQEIAQEMQQQGLLQGRQPIGYTGSK